VFFSNLSEYGFLACDQAEGFVNNLNTNNPAQFFAAHKKTPASRGFLLQII
jgi:hypothetical protein